MSRRIWLSMISGSSALSSISLMLALISVEILSRIPIGCPSLLVVSKFQVQGYYALRITHVSSITLHVPTIYVGDLLHVAAHLQAIHDVVAGSAWGTCGRGRGLHAATRRIVYGHGAAFKATHTGIAGHRVGGLVAFG